MEELIRITEHEGKKAVSARELHNYLESKQEFANWIKNRIEKYGLIENQDFLCLTNLSSKERGGHNKIEYVLTINCAKELSMLEANKKGQQARRYFIACEQALMGMLNGQLNSAVAFFTSLLALFISIMR